MVNCLLITACHHYFFLMHRLHKGFSNWALGSVKAKRFLFSFRKKKIAFRLVTLMAICSAD